MVAGFEALEEDMLEDNAGGMCFFLDHRLKVKSLNQP